MTKYKVTGEVATEFCFNRAILEVVATVFVQPRIPI
jgi:hypothetical protein